MRRRLNAKISVGKYELGLTPRRNPLFCKVLKLCNSFANNLLLISVSFAGKRVGTAQEGQGLCVCACKCEEIERELSTVIYC